MTRPLRLPAILAFVLLALWSGAGRADGPPQPLRVQLQWFHQAQFAGFYVAEALGFYDQAGLDVELREGGVPPAGGPAVQPLEALLRGEADVALAWLTNALAARRDGADVVNIAQIFRRPGTALLCRRSAGIRRPADIAGRRIGVWNLGDQHEVEFWLAGHGLRAASVVLVAQRPDGRDLVEGDVDCATVMTYNEYWKVLDAGLAPSDLYVVRFADHGAGFLEDGLYVRGEALDDPAARERLVRFARATAEGWRHARENPEEALATVMHVAPGADRQHQRRMLDTVLGLAEPERDFGLLDLASFDRSIEIIGRGSGDPAAVRAAARGAWTHTIQLEARPGGTQHHVLTPAVRHQFRLAVEARWFYGLDLVGTLAFGLAGFMRAVQRRYNLWGAFMLTLLPATGGGTLRDLLVGGDRHPPFIFTDPTYISLVLATVAMGTLALRVFPPQAAQSRSFGQAMAVLDTVGLAVFAVIGAKVALVADLAWFWIPICAALTCAGGGMLLDIVTGREPRTFHGEPYEEIAVAGGLLLYGLLLVANHYEHAAWLVTAAVAVTIAAVFAARMLAIATGQRSFRLGSRPPPGRR
ncbi:ABC transporter substrate-binding protein [Stella sp.]|uniref:ABC transporter substrate-binding protein n=1 Tax=Stella sp. TaxID=2912054 RepID=UPI0035B236AC